MTSLGFSASSFFLVASGCELLADNNHMKYHAPPNNTPPSYAPNTPQHLNNLNNTRILGRHGLFLLTPPCVVLLYPLLLPPLSKTRDARDRMAGTAVHPLSFFSSLLRFNPNIRTVHTCSQLLLVTIVIKRQR